MEKEKIKTVKEAMDEANLYLKYRRNSGVVEETNVESVVSEEKVNEAELDEFLSQFE